MKSITILLPGLGRSPSGGAKIVYEYANRFVEDGYKVTIVYPHYFGYVLNEKLLSTR